MTFEDMIIEDLRQTVTRLTGELQERTTFEQKLMDQIIVLQEQINTYKQKEQQQKELDDKVTDILDKASHSKTSCVVPGH